MGVDGVGEKKSTSFYIDTEHLEWFNSQPINRSDLVNDLIAEYRAGQSEIDRAVRQFRINQLQSDLRALEDEAERKREELERMQDSMATDQEIYEDELEDVLDMMEDHDMSLDPDAPRLERIARDHHGDPARWPIVVDDLRERGDDRAIDAAQWPETEDA